MSSKKLEVTLPTDTSVMVRRVFDAPARLVFDAHTKPELVQRWTLGPPGWSMPICEIDFRVGGSYHYHWRADDGSFEFGARGVYKDIKEPTRIVHTERMDGFEGESLNTNTLTEDNGRTTLTLVMEFFTKENRDGAIATGMTDGMDDTYDLLDAELERLAA